MTITPLAAGHLRRRCDPQRFTFQSTADLQLTTGIFGQPRGTRALEFGITIRSRGYNIYVLGEAGTGRITAIRRFLTERTRNQPPPDDWVYVHNFKVPHQPRAIEFPAGQGAQFRKQMEQLVHALRAEIPKALGTAEYDTAVDDIWQRVELTEQLLTRDLERRARLADFSVIKTAAGLTIAPTVEGEVMSEAQFAALSPQQQEKIDRTHAELEAVLEETLRRARQARLDAAIELDRLDRRVAGQAIAHHVNALRETYADHAELLVYLSEVYDDVLDNLDGFRPQENGSAAAVDLSRYAVNLFIDNGRSDGAPVIVEQTPLYHNLLGRIEYELRDGLMSTHFLNIKPGSLHRANGGYLVLEASDLLHDALAWDALKRSLKSGEAVLQPTNTLDGGGRVLAKSIDPEPIPLNVKLILIGSPQLYYDLYELDEDFNELFKVKADFSTEMPRDEAHELEYAHFIATRCHEEQLRHFDVAAVARLVEFGSELCGHQHRLSARFGVVADLVREAAYWADQRLAGGVEAPPPAAANGRRRKRAPVSGAFVTAADVQKALDERVFRANKLENLIDEDIEEGLIMIATDGEIVGQVNGLSIIDVGDYSFGRPSRITARTYAGSGVLHIERETDMADPIHNKGVLTMVGYLGGHYAQEHPLSFAASLTFEQNYSGVGGDSASSAELYALLSSLGDIPLRQGIAVTGSINQRGEMQPIGGVTEKIEGYFRVCKQHGLTGAQGVIMPRQNIRELMLNLEVIDAVSAGRFHIWAIDHVDEGLAIMTGLPAGARDADGQYPPESVHGRIQAALDRRARKENGDGDGDEDDSEEDDEPAAEARAASDPSPRRTSTKRRPAR